MWFQKTSPPNLDADKALRDAEKNLKRVQQRDPEIRAITEASKEFRRKNHFAADLQALFEGGGGLR